MKTKIFLFFIVIFSLYSCDILRFNRFEVDSWLPGEGFHLNPEEIMICLNFSLEPNRGSVEQNFSLTGNGSRIRGTFSWNGNKMIFIPLTPLEINTDYTINLSANAHDINGLSMDESFNRDFSTRPEGERPILLAFSPYTYEIIEDQRMQVRLSFSLPVPLRSLYSSVSFNPSMTGLWHLEDNDTLAIFTPAEPWMQRTRYEMRISSSFSDINGRNIEKEFISVFNCGTDNEEPYLLSAYRITKDGEYVELNRLSDDEKTIDKKIINEDWEKEDRLLLVFSEPVDWITVKNNLSAAGEATQEIPSFVLESETGNEFVFSFSAVPVFNSLFTINLMPGVKDIAGNESKEEYFFKVCANGRLSKPPELIGFRMPMAPNEFDLQLFAFDADSIFEFIPLSDEFYPSGEAINTWIELYFDAVADIDPFSIMELFRVDSSNFAVNFSPRLVKTSGFKISAPHTGWEEYQRIEISGVLTNSANFGIIYFQISAGLRDNYGNINPKSQIIPVIK